MRAILAMVNRCTTEMLKAEGRLYGHLIAVFGELIGQEVLHMMSWPASFGRWERNFEVFGFALMSMCHDKKALVKVTRFGWWT